MRVKAKVILLTILITTLLTVFLIINVAISNAETGDSLNLSIRQNDPAIKSNTMQINMKLKNTGQSAIQLADMKVRYYFTADTKADLNFMCDWISIGKGAKGSFYPLENFQDADKYLEITFPEAKESLSPGNVMDIYARVWKSDWSNFDFSNDYSITTGTGNYKDSENIPVLVNGNLICGIGPAYELSLTCGTEMYCQ